MAHNCGTCGHFQVKPTEVELSRIAKPMSECGPGEYCHGGPVRGSCRLWQQQMDSTMGCASIGKPDRWCPGGPTIAGYDAAECVKKQKADRGSRAVETPASEVSGTLVAVGLVGVSALVVGALSEFIRPKLFRSDWE